MAPPLAKKLKISLKKERKDEMHQWANALQKKIEDTHERVHAKKTNINSALVRRELTGNPLSMQTIKKSLNSSKKKKILNDAKSMFEKQSNFGLMAPSEKQEYLAKLRKAQGITDKKLRQKKQYEELLKKSENQNNLPKKFPVSFGKAVAGRLQKPS